MKTDQRSQFDKVKSELAKALDDLNIINRIFDSTKFDYMPDDEGNIRIAIDEAYKKKLKEFNDLRKRLIKDGASEAEVGNELQFGEIPE
jgi:hypothetical protein